MKAATHTPGSDVAGQRLLTFEIGAAVYALPIADVLEVAEVAPMACIPTLSRQVAGVVNHHGDALPVMSREALFELNTGELPGERRDARHAGDLGHFEHVGDGKRVDRCTDLEGQQALPGSVRARRVCSLLHASASPAKS